MKAIKLSQEQVIRTTVNKLKETNEDVYCVFWGFVKSFVKNKDIQNLELKLNEYYILKGKKIFGIK